MAEPRKKRLSASQEDYLEAILLEVRRRGTARVRDIAARLEVAMPSVTGALKALARRRLIHYSPYEQVTLTDRGRQQAERVAGRHRVLQRFFTEVLGVSRPVAAANACRIEHAVDETILQRMARWLDDAPGGRASGTAPGRRRRR